MELKRAKAILNSTENINVTYNNDPVWINSLDPDGTAVNVRLLDSDKTMQIPVYELKEY